MARECIKLILKSSTVGKEIIYCKVTNKIKSKNNASIKNLKWWLTLARPTSVDDGSGHLVSNFYLAFSFKLAIITELKKISLLIHQHCTQHREKDDSHRNRFA